VLDQLLPRARIAAGRRLVLRQRPLARPEQEKQR
jgi:hypothetical protein